MSLVRELRGRDHSERRTGGSRSLGAQSVRTLTGRLAAVSAIALGLVAGYAPRAAAEAYSFVGAGVDVLIDTNNALDAAGGYDITDIRGSVAGFGTIASLETNPNQPNPYTNT